MKMGAMAAKYAHDLGTTSIQCSETSETSFAEFQPLDLHRHLLHTDKGCHGQESNLQALRIQVGTARRPVRGRLGHIIHSQES
jgi:hypothetical protein